MARGRFAFPTPVALLAAAVVGAGCLGQPNGASPDAPGGGAGESGGATSLVWDSAGLSGDIALRLAFHADAPRKCAFNLTAAGRYGVGAPVLAWAAFDVDDPPAAVLVQDGLDAGAAGVSNHDAASPAIRPWAAAAGGELDPHANDTLLLSFFALGPDATKAHLEIRCDGPMGTPDAWVGQDEVVGLTVVGSDEGAGAGAGPLALAVGERWARTMAAPHILVRIVQGPRGQLAEQGQVVVRHPGGEETVSLPAPSQVHRLDGPSGDYALEIQRLQAGSYSGALLVLGLAPATDLAAAGLALA